MLLGWMIVAMLLALVRLWPAGVLAQAAGLLYGWAVGMILTRTRWPRWSGMGVLAGLALLALDSLFWMPWSMPWVQWRVSKEIKDGQYDQVLRRLAPGLREEDPLALNGTAWTLATARADRIRDGQRAIALARQAAVKTQWREPSIIDTLAAAYAETGQWAKADATQTLAIRTLEDLARDLGLRVEALGRNETDYGSISADQPLLAQALAELKENQDKIRHHEKIRE
jgi:hypothetical protein